MHKNKISGIYKIINKVNKKYYIGSSNNILKRKCDHFWMLQNEIHDNCHLQAAYKKYSKENFEFIIIEQNIPIDQLLIVEQKYLDVAKKEKRKCYNISFIAERLEMSEETKRKISISNTGKIMSEQSKLKMSLVRKGKRTGKDNPMYGKCHTQETKQKISEKKLGKQIGQNNPFYGKKHSEETKLKMKKNHKRLKGNNNPNSDKTIYSFFNPVTQETFNGTRCDFSQKYNLYRHSVDKLVRGTRKSHKNWIKI